MGLSFDPVAVLPSETVLPLFALLDNYSLAQCLRVSKIWNALINDPFFWKTRVDAALLSLPADIARELKERAEFLSKKQITQLLPRQIFSREDLIHRIELFFKKVSLEDNAIFTCAIYDINEADPQKVEIQVIQKQHEPECFKLTENFISHSLTTTLQQSTDYGVYQAKFIQKIQLNYEFRLKKQNELGSLFQRSHRLTSYFSKHFFLPPHMVVMVLKFPVLPSSNYNRPVDMECKIGNLIQSQIDRLAGEIILFTLKKMVKSLTPPSPRRNR